MNYTFITITYWIIHVCYVDIRYKKYSNVKNKWDISYKQTVLCNVATHLKKHQKLKIYSMKWGLISFNRLTNNQCKSQHQMYKKKEINQWWKNIYYSYTQIKVSI